MSDTSDSRPPLWQEEAPLSWSCDRCGAHQSERSLRVWYHGEKEFALCDGCSVDIVLAWFDAHEQEIAARRSVELEGP